MVFFCIMLCGYGDCEVYSCDPFLVPCRSQTLKPSSSNEIVYAEGLKSGYRDASLIAAFPFGHGLSYSEFAYSPLSVTTCSVESAVLCVTGGVRNEGKVSSATVSQLYVQFPPEAGQPSKILKGFLKSTLLGPGEVAQLHFALSSLDLSYYKNGSWVQIHSAILHLGESSEDIRQTLSVQIL